MGNSVSYDPYTTATEAIIFVASQDEKFAHEHRRERPLRAELLLAGRNSDGRGISMPLAEAEIGLADACKNGRVHARGVKTYRSGITDNLDPAEISTDEWGHLTLHEEGDEVIAETLNQRGDVILSASRWVNLRFKRDEVLAAFTQRGDLPETLLLGASADTKGTNTQGQNPGVEVGALGKQDHSTELIALEHDGRADPSTPLSPENNEQAATVLTDQASAPAHYLDGGAAQTTVTLDRKAIEAPERSQPQPQEANIRSDHRRRADRDIVRLNHLARHYRDAIKSEALEGESAILDVLLKRGRDHVTAIGERRLRDILGGRNKVFTKLVEAGEYEPFWPYPKQQ